jgi:hypothetical protein
MEKIALIVMETMGLPSAEQTVIRWTLWEVARWRFVAVPSLPNLYRL